jgi:hypothetical protein
MLTATVLFAVAFVGQLDGYDHGQIDTLGLVFGLAAEALLAAGGFIGGTIVFVYGNRVLKRPDTSVTDALVPGRADPDRRAEPSPPADLSPYRDRRAS